MSTDRGPGAEPAGAHSRFPGSAWPVVVAVLLGVALIGVGLGTRMTGAPSISGVSPASNSAVAPVANDVGAAQPGADKPNVGLGGGISCYSAIDGSLTIGDGVPKLDRVRVTHSKESTEVSAPPDPANSSDHLRYCTEAKVANSFAQDTRVDIWYQVAVGGSNSNKKLFVHGWAQQAALFVGGSSQGCDIRKDSADGAQTNVSQYNCTVSNESTTGGLNKPHFTITKRAATVLDISTPQGQQKAADLVNGHCRIGGDADCSYVATKQSITAAPREDWVLVGSTLPNCTSQLAPNSATDSQTLSWQDRIGGKISAKGEIKEILEISVEVNYQHTISASHTFSQTVGMQVSPGREGGFWRQNGQFLITGNFEVVDNGTLYSINDLTVFFPLDKDYIPDSKHPELAIHPGRLWALEFPVTCPPTGAPPPALQGAAPNATDPAPSPPPASAVPVPTSQQPTPNPLNEK